MCAEMWISGVGPPGEKNVPLLKRTKNSKISNIIKRNSRTGRRGSRKREGM